MAKTNAEKQREYRERKKANIPPKRQKILKAPAKTARERVRLYRERKKLRLELALAALQPHQSSNLDLLTSSASTHNLHHLVEMTKEWGSTASKGDESLDVMITERKIKEEPIESVETDDVILPDTVKSDHSHGNLPLIQEQEFNNVVKSAPVSQAVGEKLMPKLPSPQRVEKVSPAPQPLVLLLPSQFVNPRIQNAEKSAPLPQFSVDSVYKQSKSQGNLVLNNVNKEKESDPTSSQKQKKSFDEALESLPLTLQSSILERLDSLSRHIETNTCAVSILSKAVNNLSNISDGLMQAISAVNNLSKSLTYIGNTLEQVLQKSKENDL